MAIQPFTGTEINYWLDHYCHVITWTTMANGDSGAPLQMTGSVIRSVQVQGTFGAGGTCLIEGSNDGVNYITLTDQSNAALSITAASLKTIQQNSQFMRPRVSAGDGTTAIVVTFVVGRVRR